MLVIQGAISNTLHHHCYVGGMGLVCFARCYIKEYTYLVTLGYMLCFYFALMLLFIRLCFYALYSYYMIGFAMIYGFVAV